MDIDIDKYISEKEKTEIAKEVYRDIIKQEIKEKRDLTKNMDNFERVISNAVHYFLEEECQSILGANIDLKAKIKENTERVILNKTDYQYSIFRRKSAWEKEDSLGEKIIQDTIRENAQYIKDKIKESIDNFVIGLDKDYWQDRLHELAIEVISEKFSIKNV